MAMHTASAAEVVAVCDDKTSYIGGAVRDRALHV